MAHFAELDESNMVLRVIVIDNNDMIDETGQESEALGIELCKYITGGGRWVQTSYSGKIRKNYAGTGFYYDEEMDAFIPLKKYDSWVLNSETAKWESPIPKPELTPEEKEGKYLYIWNEDLKEWILTPPPSHLVNCPQNPPQDS